MKWYKNLSMKKIVMPIYGLWCVALVVAALLNPLYAMGILLGTVAIAALISFGCGLMWELDTYEKEKNNVD